MWDLKQRSRFQQLRQREQEGALSESERAELALLVAELEAAESAYLAVAVRQMRQERNAIDDKNRSLEALVQRKESLVRRLGTFLAEANAERDAIAIELSEVLGTGRNSHSDD
jgi:hypothetical protein